MRRFSPILLAPLAVLWACSSSPRAGDLGASDFRRPGPAPQPDLVVAEVRTATPEGMRQGLVDVGSYVGEPPAPVSDPEPVEKRVLVDAKVGDLNGKPIYANEFLAKLKDRLVAEVPKNPRDKWMDLAASLITLKLRNDLQDDLFAEEAKQRLPAQTRAGLFNFMQRFREDLLSRNRGVLALAERRIGESREQTIEQYEEDQLQKALVDLTQRRLLFRVNVSWFDIETYYERNWERFNPPPTAVLRRIVVGTGDTDAAGEVTRRLEAGEPFADVAQIPGNLYGSDSRFEKRFEHTRDHPFTLDDFRHASFFSVDAYNEAIRGLDPGGWVGPIEHDGRLAWFFLETIEQESTSIYDAQAEIKETLRIRKFREEQDRQFFSLLRQAGITDFDEIVARLLDIAAERYYPEEN